MAAMSLEELLTKEGFKGRKLKMLSRASFASDPVGRSSYHRQPPASSSSSSPSSLVKRIQRTKSDLPCYNSHLPMNNETRSRGKAAQKEAVERHEEEKKKPPKSGKNQFKSRSSSFVQNGDTFSSDNNHWENIIQETSYSKNARSFGGSKGQLNVTDEEPPLDEIAVQAMISILGGYTKCFLNDEEFRSSLRHNCFASLNSVQQQQQQDLITTDSKVIENLEEAIETVERAAENSATVKELKRASLQLSVITGLNSKDLRDGFTSGIPNSMLSSCAHLYLSIIYKIQKKMRISAKHLLQVFCDTPYQARKMLLAEVWDHLFYPHLSHLKIWYEEEANSLADSPNKMKKLKLVEKVYNEKLDSGTQQFASYYKDWLTEGTLVPAIPSIPIPSTISVHRVLETVEDGFEYHSAQRIQFGGFDKHPMVSKRLYDSVFSHSHKPPEVVEIHEEIDNNIGSSDSSIIEDKQETTEPIEESSIPKDFICPLTGLVFTEPATLETGQTFERSAIADWLLNQGKRTCPVTGTKLESQSVPPVNFILKRVIDEWKSGFFRNNQAFSILEQLLKSNQTKSAENATSLLTELICMNRRKDMNIFLSGGLKKEEILNMINVLLQYLLRSPLEQRPIIAVLLLHIDLMVEHDSTESICREKAVDAIIMAMDLSFSNEKVRVNCCKALLMLGGRFSASGKIMTEDWILRQTGFLENKESSVQSDEEDIPPLDDDEEEETSNKTWLRSVSASLIGYGEKSFLDSISKCLASRIRDLVRVCLITVAWWSSALDSCSNIEYQLSAFSALISPLKECLENGHCLEIKIIASMCLLNFSKIPGWF
ncbi:uncharacterized protein LOC124931438 isoform X2 [Impatiens glandulifera]|uniref:uncharacterized protein LOC124931438 isoform X2 n=1 Tax=Impatiens glandulifera TaxID=253017 RepID=UPI001FB102D4|nr:uncharacterized protein LOC124931438 isoform X2 [Impatiens glandulifera]